MYINDINELHRFVKDQIACPLCQAKPGHGCTTPSGRDIGYLHSVRIRPAYRIWFAGEKAGMKRALAEPHASADLIAYWEKQATEEAERRRR